MEVIPINKAEVEKAFTEIFLLTTQSLKVQSTNLENILKLEEDEKIFQAYDTLLKFGKVRFPQITVPTVDFAYIQAPLERSESLETLEAAVRSLFIKCAITEAQVLKEKSDHLRLILELTATVSVQKAYELLISYCKTYRYM